jgi:hypothetical protein
MQPLDTALGRIEPVRTLTDRTLFLRSTGHCTGRIQPVRTLTDRMLFLRTTVLPKLMPLFPLHFSNKTIYAFLRVLKRILNSDTTTRLEVISLIIFGGEHKS